MIIKNINYREIQKYLKAFGKPIRYKIKRKYFFAIKNTPKHKLCLIHIISLIHEYNKNKKFMPPIISYSNQNIYYINPNHLDYFSNILKINCGELKFQNKRSNYNPTVINFNYLNENEIDKIKQSIYNAQLFYKDPNKFIKERNVNLISPLIKLNDDFDSIIYESTNLKNIINILKKCL